MAGITYTCIHNRIFTLKQVRQFLTTLFLTDDMISPGAPSPYIFWLIQTINIFVQKIDKSTEKYQPVPLLHC